MCVFDLHPLFPSSGGRTRALSSDCKIDQSDLTDWMSFPQSNPMEKINSNLESLSANGLLSAWDRCKDKNDLGINNLI